MVLETKVIYSISGRQAMPTGLRTREQLWQDLSQEPVLSQHCFAAVSRVGERGRATAFLIALVKLGLNLIRYCWYLPCLLGPVFYCNISCSLFGASHLQFSSSSFSFIFFEMSVNLRAVSKDKKPEYGKQTFCKIKFK